MPAVPPRAAVANVGSAAADDPHEPGTTQASLAADRKDRKDKEGDKDTKDHIATGSASRSSSSAPAVTKDKKQRDRDAALLREKDERISFLEAELTTMEREFTRELDKLSQNESETATFWQSKHSALNQQFLRTDTKLRLLRDEVEERKTERDELRQGWEVLHRELRERDDEIRELRGQVRGLKEFVSTSTRTDGQTSDEVFGDGMARLGNGLQNWVIVNFRKTKLGMLCSLAGLWWLYLLPPLYSHTCTDLS
jgi:chromosome segregation ATPase